jgi:hypothetical protein
MTTRQQTLKRTNIGHSRSLESLMVHIPWTSSKVVRISANKDFTLQGATVKVLHDEYSVLADAPVNVRAGQVLYFVESDGFPGYYYVLTYQEARFAFTCSCPKSYHFHKVCGHSQHAMTFVGHRYARRIETEHFIDQDWEAHIEDDLRQAKQERAYEHLASVPLHVEETRVEYARVA